MSMRVEGGGSTYLPPEGETLDRRLTALDQAGEHLWCVTAAWRVPEPGTRSGDPMLLDTENMLAFGGTGCFKCEQTYSEQLAARPCTGSVT